MNEIKIFENQEFGRIRTMIMPDGQVGFVGKDVAKVLEYKDASKAICDHVDNDDKTTLLFQQSGSNYKSKTTFINESGLYSLILSSKLPKAREFKHWVTSEVLPQIRKTGGYIPVSEDDNEKTILAKAVKILTRTVEMQNKVLAKRDQEIARLSHKAEYAEEVLEAPGCMTTTQLAKSLGTTAVELNYWLREMGIQYRQSGQYMLYAEYARMGLGRHRTFLWHDEEGAPHTRQYLVWTEKGKEFVTGLYGMRNVG